MKKIMEYTMEHWKKETLDHINEIYNKLKPYNIKLMKTGSSYYITDWSYPFELAHFNFYLSSSLTEGCFFVLECSLDLFPRSDHELNTFKTFEIKSENDNKILIEILSKLDQDRKLIVATKMFNKMQEYIERETEFDIPTVRDWKLKSPIIQAKIYQAEQLIIGLIGIEGLTALKI